MKLHIEPNTSKTDVINSVIDALAQKHISIITTDAQRPWGAFMVIDDQSIPAFLSEFFPEEKNEVLATGLKITPKILIVSPDAKLSWQYHHRRNELWRVISGPVQVITSQTDTMATPATYDDQQLIVIQDGMRHRLIGMSNYGVVAEIWRHTDSKNPSDEEDIVRVSDHYGRQ